MYDYNYVMKRFEEAENFYVKNMFIEASEVYLEIEPYESVRALCRYRLAQISNNEINEPLTAYDLYYSALEIKPDLFSIVLGKDHSSHNYIFTKKNDELEMNSCQLCGDVGKPF